MNVIVWAIVEAELLHDIPHETLQAELDALNNPYCLPVVLYVQAI